MKGEKKQTIKRPDKKKTGTGKKILILTASPIRDRYIDELISRELTKRGHEVWIRPCQREGRQAILDIQPDIVVWPPVKNPFARDGVEMCRHWSVGAVVRHTEASCDWSDFKKMTPMAQAECMGRLWPYPASVEIVWGPDEEDILNRRNTGFKAMAVGSFALDPYLDKDITGRFASREQFNAKHKFTKSKTLLIACPWGFADSAPDLDVDAMKIFSKQQQAKMEHVKMIKAAKAHLGKGWNILVTLHPGIDIKEYQEHLKGFEIDVESASIELMLNSDALIHGGGTLAMEAHVAGIPAWRFQDQNCLTSGMWFDNPDVPMAKVSPSIKCICQLKEAFETIRTSERKSNADATVLENLRLGRYGQMDGKAYVRAADIIEKVEGKFKLRWPPSRFDYDMPGATVKELHSLVANIGCQICGNKFFIYRPHLDRAPWLHCPHCGVRMFPPKMPDGYNRNNPGSRGLNPAPQQGLVGLPQKQPGQCKC